MLFKSQAGADKSSSIVIDIASIAKRLNSDIIPIFMDFTLQAIMNNVEPSGTICGTNDSYTEVVKWHNTEDLAVNLREFNPMEIEIAGNPVTVDGLCSVTYDKPTRALFVKSNALGISQKDSPSIIIENYISYMLAYRQLKKNNTTSHRKLNKPNNFYRREHELFMMGYMPLALISGSSLGDMTQIVQEVVELTPLVEGMLTERAYDTMGRALDDYEMLWVSKKSVDKFMSFVRPGYYDVTGYEGINMLNLLVTLFEYSGHIDGNDFCTRYGYSLPNFSPVQPVPFKMGVTMLESYTESVQLAQELGRPELVKPYDLEIKRMYPVINGVVQDPNELLNPVSTPASFEDFANGKDSTAF